MICSHSNLLEFYTDVKSAICPYTRGTVVVFKHTCTSEVIHGVLERFPVPPQICGKSEFIRMDPEVSIYLFIFFPEASIFKAGIVLCVQDYGSIL